MLLRIVLSCLSFSSSHGLSFDYFRGNVTVGIPITLSWHREANDSSRIEFVLRSLLGEASLDGLHLLNATDTTQLNGTIEVAFPGSGEYTVEAITNQTGVVTIAAAQRFEVTSSSTGTEPSSSSTMSVKRTGTSPRRTSIIIGAVLGTVVSLVLLVGGGAFLVIRHRGRRNWKHCRLSPNPKIHPGPGPGPEQGLHSPPVGNKNSETIFPMLEESRGESV
ncbi:hypothetical protein EDD18DRAFT_449354 [Armillaria luteobubalina]|uniref:Mid2 domain-containing protein n=1 Tax=Armillaria luteobubalina TaxID=153913 RepID=A0AA39UL97_9AGAR|nr:hypothetical protein EDD18DRAFT_449354 [Armillaria luteobubalina]